jgi:hypothetical protein
MDGAPTWALRYRPLPKVAPWENTETDLRGGRRGAAAARRPRDTIAAVIGSDTRSNSDSVRRRPCRRGSSRRFITKCTVHAQLQHTSGVKLFHSRLSEQVGDLRREQKGAAVFGDRIDGSQQFARGGAERDLVWFCPLDHAPVESHGPRVALSRGAKGRQRDRWRGQLEKSCDPSIPSSSVVAARHLCSTVIISVPASAQIPFSGLEAWSVKFVNRNRVTSNRPQTFGRPLLSFRFPILI